MKLADFDYSYPEALVAQRPLSERDASKMMVVNRAKKSFTDAGVQQLSDYLEKGDVLVINDSKVFPARLFGKKESGSEIELLLLEEVNKDVWRALATRKKRLKEGAVINFDEGLQAKVLENSENGVVVGLSADLRHKNIPAIIEAIGLPPLPPYIKRTSKEDYTDEDRARYQTLYAKHIGSAAAPTAGFHLSEKILEDCRLKGINIAPITLHVGIDTFSPVREEIIEDHKMHGERYFISTESAKIIAKAKSDGKKVVAIGTTSVRALESMATTTFCHCEEKGNITNIFIYPGYKFKVVDAMLTNFHQPKSTLLMLVSAFAEREFILQMYAEAIKRRYRLFSYGDCMLIL